MRMLLQLFATNTTESKLAGNDLSAEMKTYYEKRLIDLAEPKLVHDQFGDKYPIPAGNGRTIEFRKYDSLASPTTTTSPGSSPSPSPARKRAARRSGFPPAGRAVPEDRLLSSGKQALLLRTEAWFRKTGALLPDKKLVSDAPRGALRHGRVLHHRRHSGAASGGVPVRREGSRNAQGHHDLRQNLPSVQPRAAGAVRLPELSGGGGEAEIRWSPANFRACSSRCFSC